MSVKGVNIIGRLILDTRFWIKENVLLSVSPILRISAKRVFNPRGGCVCSATPREAPIPTEGLIPLFVVFSTVCYSMIHHLSSLCSLQLDEKIYNSIMKRAIVLIMDGVGIGALPDAAQYGDEGSNTLANLADRCIDLRLPVLQSLGLGNIAEIKGVEQSRAWNTSLILLPVLEKWPRSPREKIPHQGIGNCVV